MDAKQRRQKASEIFGGPLRPEELEGDYVIPRGLVEPVAADDEPMTEEQVILHVLFDLQWRRGELPTAIEGSTERADNLRAHIDRQIDALGRVLVALEHYRKLQDALAVLRG